MANKYIALNFTEKEFQCLYESIQSLKGMSGTGSEMDEETKKTVTSLDRVLKRSGYAPIMSGDYKTIK